jgi:ABC-type antimicrobial peptide transport system permease subunit
VVSDAKYRSVQEPIVPTFYQPDPYFGGTLVVSVRTASAPQLMVRQLRQELAKLDPGMVIVDIETLAEEADASSSGERLTAAMGSMFAGISLFLTSVGIHGLLAFLAAQRQHEIGIRLALGATKTNITLLIGRQAFAMAPIGIGLGLTFALWATPLVGSLLYGVRPSDPWVLMVAAGTMFLLAGIASTLPAARAARIDPLAALRGNE